MKYYYNLQKSIAEVGRWLTENAEEIATTIEYQRGTRIVIDYSAMDEICPQITIEKEFISKGATDALYDKGNAASAQKSR